MKKHTLTSEIGFKYTTIHRLVYWKNLKRISLWEVGYWIRNMLEFKLGDIFESWQESHENSQKFYVFSSVRRVATCFWRIQLSSYQIS